METVGIIVFACLMSCVALLLIVSIHTYIVFIYVLHTLFKGYNYFAWGSRLNHLKNSLNLVIHLI